jgi:ABC-type branched-subunit amino acid transport system ATPase component
VPSLSDKVAGPVLAVEHLTCRYGGLAAVSDVSFEVHQAEIVALVGPNGAGKTTLLNAVSGLISTAGGVIQMMGQDVTREAPYRRTARGMARSFQLIRLFPSLSVLENVQIGMHTLQKCGVVRTVLFSPLRRREEGESEAKAVMWLKQLGLGDRLADPVSELSFGEQRLVEMARLLVSDPRLLLLDEPIAGMEFGEVSRLADLVMKQAQEGRSVLLIEHNLAFVRAVASRAVVIDYGKVLAEGPVAQALSDPRVIEAYLGTNAASA